MNKIEDRFEFYCEKINHVVTQIMHGLHGLLKYNTYFTKKKD